MLKMMTTGESKWSLRQWKKIIDAQTSSWAMYIPGMSSSTEVKDLQSFKAILDCFTETELDDSSKINSLTRERVAKSANGSVDDVNKLVQAYKQSDIISTWLNLKKSLGEELPKSEEELMDLQSKDTRLRAIASKVYV
jgi:signal recognition particle GTPase